jgi:hypothetical protein
MNARMQSEMSHMNRRLSQMPWRSHTTSPGIEALSSLPIVTDVDVYMLYVADDNLGAVLDIPTDMQAISNANFNHGVRLSHPPHPTVPEFRRIFFRFRFSRCSARFPSNNQEESGSEGSAAVAGIASPSTAVLEQYDIDLTYEWFKEVRVP